jgi:hypothetical protein
MGFYAQLVQKFGSVTGSKISEMNIMSWLPTLSFFTIFISSANSQSEWKKRKNIDD